jgi:hypothetical protein
LLGAREALDAVWGDIIPDLPMGDDDIIPDLPMGDDKTLSPPESFVVDFLLRNPMVCFVQT